MTLVLFAILAAHAPLPLEAIYERARRYDKETFKFTPPSPERLRAVESLAAALLAAAPAPEPPAPLLERAAAAGLELLAARDAAGALWVLREPEGKPAGGGLYAFRPGGVPLCVQAPHSFFDTGTGALALDLFARMGAACFAVNTVHRYAPAAVGGGAPADVAHAPATLFQAVSKAALHGPHHAVVQLHGFGKRDDLPAEAAAVVSDGSAHPAPGSAADRLRRALARTLGAKVLLFGEDADVLGATTNTQAREARRAGARFLHIEMREDVRRKLAATGTAALAEALREALQLR
jgi:hypothetical protein